MNKNIFFLFAALLTGGLLASCSSDDTDDEKSYGGYEKKNYRLEVQANNGVGTRTLIYDANQNTITPSWTLGEEVGVHTPDDNGFGEITDIHLGKVVSNHTGNPTTLVGDFPQLSGNIQKGSQLIFTFPKSGEGGGTFNYYDGQDGTLETIASNFDYATATAEVEDFLQEGDKLYIQLKGGNHLNFINHTSHLSFASLCCFKKFNSVFQCFDFHFLPITTFEIVNHFSKWCFFFFVVRGIDINNM